ncbi:MAG: hypothetical protein ACK59R_00150 [Pseudomonadota bacterium]
MALSITIDDRRALRALERQLDRVAKNVGRELERATISVQRATFTESKRAITEVYNLPQNRVAGPLSVNTAANRRGFVVRGNPTPITFVSYRARALTRGGVQVAILKGKAKVIRKGFKAPSPQGTDLFWIRTGEEPRRMTRGRYAGQTREPIRPLTGPSVADHLNNRSVRGRIERFYFTRMNRELLARINRLQRNRT